MIRINISGICLELRPIILEALFQQGIKNDNDQSGKDKAAAVNIITLNGQDDVQKIKQTLEYALSSNDMQDYMIAENTKDETEIAILKKGDIEQLGLYLCSFCPSLFGSEIERNVHQRTHYFGF